MNRPTSEEVRNFDHRFCTFKEETEPYNDELEFHDDFEAAPFDGDTDGYFVPKFSTPRLNLFLVSRLFRDEGYKTFYGHNSFSLIDEDHGPALAQTIAEKTNFIRHVALEQHWQLRVNVLPLVPPATAHRLDLIYRNLSGCDALLASADFPSLKSIFLRKHFVPSIVWPFIRGGLPVETEAGEEFHLETGDDPMASPGVRKLMEDYMLHRMAITEGLDDEDERKVNVTFTYDLAVNGEGGIDFLRWRARSVSWLTARYSWGHKDFHWVNDKQSGQSVDGTASEGYEDGEVDYYKSFGQLVGLCTSAVCLSEGGFLGVLAFELHWMSRMRVM